MCVLPAQLFRTSDSSANDLSAGPNVMSDAFGISAIYLLVGVSSYVFLLGNVEQVAPEPIGGAV